MSVLLLTREFRGMTDVTLTKWEGILMEEVQSGVEVELTGAELALLRKVMVERGLAPMV